ncbi:pleckstrin-like isoform X2 [Brienomyrus brachyistius]|uniref:pleckstrin-like isoform X2 n=1 Tax=Brienomyrus brachyistius TaxID=42636 RepID=UPI0020B395AD|nr:pleckstrin-like isoform X2 [Brienomyrus brachyistius]
MEPQQVREGYLVKKRTLLNSWKVVWVILSDDGVEIYRKKVDSTPKAMIPLKGAKLSSTCQDFLKRTFVFKISTPKSHDHFFQATHLEEMEVWVKDIQKTIAGLDGGMKFARRSVRRASQLPSTVNISELYNSMKDQNTGIKEKKLERNKRTFNQCFTGSQAVDWLVSQGRARNRTEALMLATGLLDEGYLQPAGEVSKKAAAMQSVSVLLDQSDAFYYFMDSGFFSEGYSSDEDTVTKEEFKGIIIKQGCLVKQDGGDPLGSIHLRGSVVTAVDHLPEAKKSDDAANLFEIITSDEIHYFLQATTAKERKEWIQAIHEVAKTGK